MAALPVAGPIERVSSAIGRVVPGLAGSTADILASGAVGAGYGAAYGAGDSSAQGGDIVSGAGYGALAGGIGGAAAPMLAEGISNAAGSAGRAIQGVFAPEAAGRAKAIAQIASDQAKGASMLSPEEINAAASAGQPVIAGDLGGKGTQVLARKVANENPDASQILTDPAASRFANQNTRLAEFVDNLYGGNVNPDKMKADLKNLGKTYLSPLYDKAMQEGADGIWTPTLQDLTATDPMQTAIKGATSIGKTQAVLKGNQVVPNPFAPLPDGSLALRDPNVAPSLEFWDVVQKSLKDQITSLRGKPFEQSNVIGVRNALLEQMDAAAPTYKLARQGAYEKFNAEDALEAGQNILKKITPAGVVSNFVTGFTTIWAVTYG
jgi:hypothetical protein